MLDQTYSSNTSYVYVPKSLAQCRLLVKVSEASIEVTTLIKVYTRRYRPDKGKTLC
uniref:Transposase n=1 Tax=Heterorhabditis bacteriophora TaxID=37862 RepID=A0A1I7WIN8_HETBA